MVLRISPTTGAQAVAFGDRGIERQHDQRQRAVLRQQLAADDLVATSPWRSARHRPAPVGSGSGNSGAGSCPFSGGWRAENSEMMPRVPSMSCRSVTEVAQLRRAASRSSRSLPSTTTSTSNSLDGKRRGHLLVLLELGRVGAEQLAQRIVDLEPVETEHRSDHQQGEDDRADDGGAKRDQPDALDPVGQRMQPACRRPGLRSAGLSVRRELFQASASWARSRAHDGPRGLPAAEGILTTSVPLRNDGGAGAMWLCLQADFRGLPHFWAPLWCLRGARPLAWRPRAPAGDEPARRGGAPNCVPAQG